MRFEGARAMLVILPLWLLSAASAQSAQTFKVPISVVAGTVRVNNVVATIPFSVPITDPGCPGGSAVFSAEIVDGAIEMRFSGAAFGGADPDVPCLLNGGAQMDVELHVPEVGGSATMMRVEAEALEGTFSSVDSASTGMVLGNVSRSSSVPGYFMLEQQFVSLGWDHNGFQPNGSQTRLQPMVPGDTLRLPVSFNASFSGTTTRSTQGTMRARFLFKVTVPEPSASLSVPIGALSLASMAGRRAGR